MIPPMTIITHKIVIESPDKNIECLSLTLIPSNVWIIC